MKAEVTPRALPEGVKRIGWFAVFTAVFAVLAAFVFWGTWSTNFAPVMPDSAIVYPPHWLWDCWCAFLETGRISPPDLFKLGSPYFWQELQYAISLYAAGLALAYFLRGRGLSRPAALGAGLLLAFCGYWSSLFSAGHLGWFFMSAQALWAFGLTDRLVCRGQLRHALMLGAVEGWACCWQADIWPLFALLAFIYFAYACVRERRFPWKGVIAAAAAFMLVGGAGVRTAFVNDLASRESQLEGASEDGRGKAGSAGKPKAAGTEESPSEAEEQRWIFVTNWSLPGDEVAEFFNARLNGDTSCPYVLSIGAQRGSGVRPYTGAIGRQFGAPQGNYRQQSVYVGWVTCLLALAGLLAGLFRRRRADGDWLARDARFFALLAVVFAVFSLGRYCEPVYRVVFHLPFFGLMRCPVKWHHLTEFCLCALAGFGIQALVDLCRLLPKKAGRIALVALGAVVLLGAFDLARIDRLYCAPVDISEARRQNGSFNFAFLRRGDFAQPQVAAMVRQRRIVPVANPSPDMYLVGVVSPWGPRRPLPPFGTAAVLGVLSALSSLGIVAFALGGWRRRKRT